LQKHPTRHRGGCPEYDPEHQVPTGEQDESQKHENARDQARAPEHALARLSSTANAHEVASWSVLTTTS
jgi:hypothetical protein